MSLNLVTVCGHNTTMLKHMLNHYKDIVDDIFVVAYLHKKDDGVLEEIKKIVSDIGSDIYNKIVLEPFNWEKVTSLYNEIISKKPDEWWIVSDDDEFHVYPFELNDIIDSCENSGYKFVTGAFLDRIGEGGSFPEVNDDSDIWKQLPLGGSFRMRVSNACPNKVPIIHGSLRLENGQHYVVFDDGSTSYGKNFINHPSRYPVDQCFIQVHHFKWDSSIIKRLKQVSSIKEKYTYHWEYQKMLDFIVENDYKIPIDNSKFYIERIGNKFTDHLKWDNIVKESLFYKQ